MNVRDKIKYLGIVARAGYCELEYEQAEELSTAKLLAGLRKELEKNRSSDYLSDVVTRMQYVRDVEFIHRMHIGGYYAEEENLK